MAPRRSRTETREETRRRLLVAATAVFGEKGFHRASAEEIAEQAGFTRGALYANFADKADLLMTLVEEQRTAALEDMVARVGAADDAAKLPTAQAWYEGITAHALDRAVSELMTHVIDDPDLRARMARQREVDRQAIASSVRGYLDAVGLELPIPVDEFAAACLAIGDGLAAQRQLDGDAVAVDLFGRAIMWLWDGVWGGSPPVP